MAKIELKGNTPEEKLAHVERILKHWQRKTNKAIVGVIPPIPIFSYIDVPNYDVIMKCVIPAAGKIVRGVMVVEKYNTDKPVGIWFNVKRGDSLFSHSFLTKKNVFVMDTVIDVEIGDVVTVKTSGQIEGEIYSIQGICLTLLYEVSIKDSTKAYYMIENLERLLEKEDEGI